MFTHQLLYTEWKVPDSNRCNLRESLLQPFEVRIIIPIFEIRQLRLSQHLVELEVIPAQVKAQIIPLPSTALSCNSHSGEVRREPLAKRHGRWPFVARMRGREAVGDLHGLSQSRPAGFAAHVVCLGRQRQNWALGSSNRDSSSGLCLLLALQKLLRSTRKGKGL